MGLPMDIFNFVDNIKKHTTEINKEDLAVIVEECKHGHFLHVLSKTKTFRENHTLNDELAKLLLLLDATCLSQVGEGKKAADIIERIYQDSNGKLVDDLILYGNLAFMCDYKLTRKIMSDAVKRINHDPIKAAHAYFILGEAEEHLFGLLNIISVGWDIWKKRKNGMTQRYFIYISNSVLFTPLFMKRIKRLNFYKKPLN